MLLIPTSPSLNRVLSDTTIQCILQVIYFIPLVILRITKLQGPIPTNRVTLPDPYVYNAFSSAIVNVCTHKFLTKVLSQYSGYGNIQTFIFTHGFPIDNSILSVEPSVE